MVQRLYVRTLCTPYVRSVRVDETKIKMKNDTKVSILVRRPVGETPEYIFVRNTALNGKKLPCQRSTVSYRSRRVRAREQRSAIGQRFDAYLAAGRTQRLGLCTKRAGSDAAPCFSALPCRCETTVRATCLWRSEYALRGDRNASVLSRKNTISKSLMMAILKTCCCT